jgi:hypothetical protein
MLHVPNAYIKLTSFPPCVSLHSLYLPLYYVFTGSDRIRLLRAVALMSPRLRRLTPLRRKSLMSAKWMKLKGSPKWRDKGNT